MDEIGSLVKELARRLVKQELALWPVTRAIQREAGLLALRAHGNGTHAARALGVSRSTLWRLRRGEADPAGNLDGRRR